MKTDFKRINKQIKTFTKWYNKQNTIIKVAVWILGIVCFLAILQVVYVVVKALVWVVIIGGIIYLLIWFRKKRE